MKKLFTLLFVVLLFAFAENANSQVTVSGALVGNGSHATLGAAFTAINGGAQTSANIVITITGNTTELSSAVLNAGTWSTVTISPSGGSWVVSGTIPALPLVDFNGADNVAVDGLNSGGNALTISNTSLSATSGTSTIRFQADATNNTIIRCSVLGSSTMPTGTNGGTIWFGAGAISSGNDNNAISFCNIGPAGANLPTKAIYGNGSSVALSNSGININNCNIFDFFNATAQSNGIYISSANTDWIINNNRFYQTAARTQTTGAIHSPIQLASANINNCTISNNIIGFATSAGTGTYTFNGVSGSRFIGIFSSGHGTTTASSITGNTITAISLSGAVNGSTSSSPFMCIHIGASGGLVNSTSNTLGSLDGSSSISFTSTSATTSEVMAYFNFATAATIVSGNNIGNITTINAAGSVVLFGIRVQTSASLTGTINNNTIGNTSAPLTNNALGTASRVIGIGVESASFTPITTMTGNTVRNVTMSAGNVNVLTLASVIGIHFITSAATGHTISQNIVHTLSNTNAALGVHVIGIQYTGPTTGTNTVSRNFVHSLSLSSTAATSSMRGILVPAGASNIQNNMIRLGINAAGGSITTGYEIMGISETGGTNNFYHNSVYIGGSGVASSSNTFAFNSTLTTGTRNYINNIFVNERSNASGAAFNVCAQYNGTLPAPAGLTTSNNIYYGTAATIIRNTTTNYTLLAWQGASNLDYQSAQVTSLGQINFINAAGSAAVVDLHVQSSTAVESAGLLVAAVTDDFDGQTRSGLTPVDVGADAGVFTTNDITPPLISYTILGNGVVTGTRSFTGVSVTDVSGVNGAGGTRPRCYYKKSTDANTFVDNTSGTNGWKFVEANGSGTPFDFTINYALLNGGGGVAVSDVIQYFVTAQDLAPTPNVGFKSGSPATLPASVNLAAGNFPFAGSINQYTISASLAAGLYAIGPSGPYAGYLATYTSLTTAAAALNGTVITGNVTFEFQSDYVDGVETYPVTFNQFSSISGTSTATFRPRPGIPTVVNDGDPGTGNALIRLNGADNIIFNGMQSLPEAGRFNNEVNTFSGAVGIGWILRSTASTGTINPTILLENDASNNTFTYLSVQSQNNNIAVATGGTIRLGTTTGTTGNDNNTFSFCDIRDRSDITTTLPFYGFVSNGSTGTAAQMNSGNVLSSNNFYNYFNPTSFATGIYLFGGTSDILISNNSFYQTASRTATATGAAIYGILLNTTNLNGCTIANNFIGGSAPLCAGGPLTFSSAFTSSFFGIYSLAHGTTTASTVSGNTIQNIAFTVAQTANANGFIGIHINAGTLNVTSNTIGSPTGNGSITITNNATGAFSSFNYGIYNIVGAAGNITGNTVGSITGNGSSTTGVLFLRGIWHSGAPPAGLTMNNNIVGSLTTPNSIQQTSTTMQCFMQGVVNAATSGTMTMDNNTIANLTDFSTITAGSTSILGILQTSTSVPTITNNTIRNLTNNTATTVLNVVGIQTSSSAAVGQTISGNTIFSLNAASTASATGAQVTGFFGSAVGGTGTITRNRIYDLRNSTSNTTGSIIAGMVPFDGSYTCSNNQISVTNGETTDFIKSGNNTESLSRNVHQNSDVKSSNTVNDYSQPVSQYASMENQDEWNKLAEKDRKNSERINKNIEKLSRNNGPSLQSSSVNNLIVGGIFDQTFAGDSWNFYYNSIYIGGSISSGTASSYGYTRLVATPVTVMRNNLIVNARTGGTGTHYVISNEATASGWSSNYNTLVGSNASTIGEWGVGVSRTIDTWRTSSGGDAQTWCATTADINPSNLFNSISTGDLSINLNNIDGWIVSGKGIAVTGQSSDFDGNPRAVTISGGVTDIGANEFGKPNVEPPFATESAVPTPGGTSTYTQWSRTLCSIDWDAANVNLPTGMQVQYFSGVPVPDPDGNYGASFMEIVKAGGNDNDSTYDFTMYFGDNETFTITTPATNSTLGRYGFNEPDPSWQAFTVPGTGKHQYELNWTAKTVKVRGIRYFSDFALTDASSPLPVDLARFDVAVSKRDANLMWVTNTELNNHGFAVERRIKLSGEKTSYGQWKEIGYVNGNGTSNQAHSYNFTDRKLNSGAYQYRLKQVDYNNNYEYHSPSNNSDVVIGTPGVFELSQNYPNPSNPKSKIDFQMPFDGKVSIKIYDIIGREVVTLVDGFKQADFYTVDFDGTNLASGVYFYRIIAENGAEKFTKTLKMVLVK